MMKKIFYFLGIICLVLTTLPILNISAIALDPKPEPKPEITGVCGYVRSNNGAFLKGAKVTFYVQGNYEGEYMTGNNGYYEIYVVHLFTGSKPAKIKVERSGYHTKYIYFTLYAGQIPKKIAYLDLASWALVIGAPPDPRYTHDAYNMYNTLIDHYGYTSDEIYFLTYYSEDRYSGGVTVPRDKQTNKANIYWAINEIATKANSQHDVIIWWTGHGKSNRLLVGIEEGEDAEPVQIYEHIYYIDQALDNIDCRHMYLFFGPCYSGSFIDELDDDQNRAIYTSCDSNEVGHITEDFKHSQWPWATYRALDPGAGAYQNAEEADDNSDGLISIYELYDYAYDYITGIYDDQNPKRWVGSLISSDSNIYIGDADY